MPRHLWWTDAAVLLLFLALACVATLALGQDANWDLQNYHFYGPWAWLHGQRGYSQDIVAAQLQTYHNPLLDVPFYWMVAAGWDPRLIACALAVPTGLAAYFTLKLAMLCLYDGSVGSFVMSLAGTLLGASSAVGIGVLGTTMGDWPGTAFIVAALFLVCRPIAAAPLEPIPWVALVGAGFLAGLATGSKLTFGVFAVGLCAAIFWRTLLEPRYWWRATRESLLFGLAVLAGTGVLGGPWMWALWQHFHSPLFPYFNTFFKSPWWGEYPVFAERVFGPHKFNEWLALPFDVSGQKAYYVAEVRFVDWRMPALYIMALTALGVGVSSAWLRRASAVRSHNARRPFWQFLGIFFIVSLLLWTWQHSILRYLLPLFLLGGVLFVVFTKALVRPEAAPAVALVACALLGWATEPADWGRIRYGDSWFQVTLPSVEPNALVLMANQQPMSYVIPYFPQDASFLGIRNSISDEGRQTLMERSIRERIGGHTGPMYLLTYPVGGERDALTVRGLAKLQETCRAIPTNMGTSPIELCRVVRSPAK